MSTRERVWNIEYEFDPANRPLIFWASAEINPLIWRYLHVSEIKLDKAFDKEAKKFTINRMIELICNDVFTAIEMIKNQKNDHHLAITITNYLFECFTNYWIQDLLEHGKDMLGILLWHEVLRIVENWENSNTNGTKIHKGTPYYFLAESYLIVGDRDLAFAYLFNALQEDKIVGELVPSLNYPDNAPAFLTATLSNNDKNHMYPLVTKLRSRINEYINEFNFEFKTNFTMDQFDKKFLQDSSGIDIVTFFVFNFLYIYESEKVNKNNHFQNDFSKLKALDLFFNLSLVIDEVLKKAYALHNGKLKDPHYISESMLWLSESSGWLTRNDLEDFWGKNNLDLNNSDPDQVLPILFAKSIKYRNNPVPNEVFTLLVAYKLRNYGGHNIKQQQIAVIEYDKIMARSLESETLFI
jgi:hypothetical protein